MGVEVVSSEMAYETVTEVEKSFPHEKENGKLDQNGGHNEVIKFGSQGEEPVQGQENNASDASFPKPKDAVDDWTVPKQIHSFYFVKYRPHDDPKIKAKRDQQNNVIDKLTEARSKLIDDIKAQKNERAEVLSQLKSLRADFDQYQSVLDEKKKEMQPLQQALGKLRTNNASGRAGLCSSEEELNDLIYSLKYRIQHESIPLSEEKQILREIKQLEGTREKVIANVAMRAKIQDSLGQKEVIQDQVKLMGADLDGVRKEQQALKAKRTQLRDKVEVYEKNIVALQDKLDDLTEKKNKAYETLKDLRKQRDKANSHLYENRNLLNKAREIAASKDISALKELSNAELEKFMALWNGSKAFRDDYEERVLESLDRRQLSRDGRIRNSDEKPLVEPVVPLPVEVETVAKPIVKQPKEDKKPSQQDVKPDQKVQKDAGKKVKDSKSSVEHAEVEDSEVSGLDKLEKEPSVDKVEDQAKLKETKREEEIAKAKQAMERKKKLAEKAAAKAAVRAQKEAEKKLKEREKKAKKKSASSGPAENPEEASEPAAEASEAEKVEENTEPPVSTPALVKEKIQKEIPSIRHRSRAKGPDALPRAVLKRKKATNYWIWAAAAAALVVLLLLAFGYNYLL
ncbi:hypothetical protein SLE2022_016340 [Rubroshorea leprosula]